MPSITETDGINIASFFPRTVNCRRAPTALSFAELILLYISKCPNFFRNAQKKKMPASAGIIIRKTF